jgi:hypothetical protein
LYGTYICSIGLGSATVDSLGQLRFTLHLCNALKQRNSSAFEDIPFLQKLDKVFAKTKAVWVGGRPEKGSYCKHLWLAWGMSIAEAKKLGAEGFLGDDEKVQSRMKKNGSRHDITRYVYVCVVVIVKCRGDFLFDILLLFLMNVL